MTSVDTTSLESRLAAVEERLKKCSPSKRSVSIVCFSGEFDRLYAAFTIAVGAASMDARVRMFFTFWGSQAMCPVIGTWKPNTLLQRLFGWVMPHGIKSLPLSRMNFWGLGPWLMRRMMNKKGIESLETLIQSTREMGVEFRLCDTSADMLGLSTCAGGETSSCGVATFVTDAMSDDLVLFI